MYDLFVESRESLNDRERQTFILHAECRHIWSCQKPATLNQLGGDVIYRQHRGCPIDALDLLY